MRQCILWLPLSGVSLFPLIRPLRQPQMLDIQIWLHLFLFPLQQIGTSDRLTIKRYYFPFFSIDGTSYTTRKPCFDWGGYNHCHKALEVGENTNRHILNKKVLKGLFLKSNSGLKQTAPHWVILRLVMPSLVISDCQSDNCEEKTRCRVRDEVVNWTGHFY